MKKLLLILFSIFALNAGISAQGYKTAAGLFVDFGDGATVVGPHIKHFFTKSVSGQGLLLFGSGATVLGAEVSHNALIPGGRGLSWNIGFGPQAWIGNNNTTFVFRPSLGMEYTISGAPINLGLDWRPAWILTDGSHFEAGRFGFAIRYIFR